MPESFTVANEATPAFKVNHIIAGFLQGMIGKNNLTEIEACYKGGAEMEHELMKAIGDFKKKGWNNITQGALDLVQIGLQIPQELHTCTNMSEDLTAVKNWALQFKDISKLTGKVTKHFLFHKKEAMADIDALKKDFVA